MQNFAQYATNNMTNCNPTYSPYNPVRYLPEGTAEAITGLFARGGAAIYAISAAAPESVASLQSSLAALADKYCGPVVTELASRTIAPVNNVFGLLNGTISLGTGVVLAAPVALPVAGAVFNSIRRTARSIMQRRCNEATRRVAHNLETSDQESSQILRQRAAELRKKGKAQKALAERRATVWDATRYMITLLAPVAVLPQLAVLASVSAPVALPLALGVGAVGCAVRFAANRFDSWRERAQGQECIQQAETMAVEASAYRQVVRLEEEKGKLTCNVQELRAQMENDTQTLTARINDMEKAKKDVETARDAALAAQLRAEKDSEDAREAQQQAKENFDLMSAAFCQSAKKLEAELKQLTAENRRLKSQQTSGASTPTDTGRASPLSSVSSTRSPEETSVNAGDFFSLTGSVAPQAGLDDELFQSASAATVTPKGAQHDGGSNDGAAASSIQLSQ